MSEWLARLRRQGRRHPFLVLIAICSFAAIFVVEDVKWQLRSVSVGVWNRYHEKFKPAPDINITKLEKVILFWTPFFGTLEFNLGYGRKPFKDCPVSNCVTTNQRRYLRRADAVVFHPLEFSDFDLPSWRSADQLWVFYMLESPPNTGGKFTEATRGLFNITMTYRRDSDIHQPYFKVVPLSESERQRSPEVSRGHAPVAWTSLTPVKNRLPWVVSNCNTPGKREQFVQELRSYIDVDMFGRCGSLKCSAPGGLLSRPDPRACYRYLADNYRFYLSLENSRCRDYITEKFFLALNNSLVPIVYGAPKEDYEAIAPPKSFLHVDDYAHPRELANHVRYLTANKDAYQEYTAWRSEYKVEGASRDGWCQLCERLNKGYVEKKVYPDINAWWSGQGFCR